MSRALARRGLAGLGLLLAFGCASSSTTSDLRHVSELTHAMALAELPASSGDPIDPETEARARELLREPLDAEAAVRVAVLNNRELRATLRDMGIARGHYVQAGLLPNPRVEAELLPERTTHLELRVEYNLTGAILAPLRARAAKPEIDAARYRAAAAVVELGYRVRAAFYDCQAAEQRLHLGQRALDAAAASRDAQRAMFEAGNVPALALAGEESAYQRARITVAQLELELALARERLHRLLGVHGEDTRWRAHDALPLAPARQQLAEDLERRALEASFELLSMKHRLEGLARRAGYTRTAGIVPDVTVDLHALQGVNPDFGADDQLRFGGGVSLGIPLFDRRQGSASALEAEFDALLERYHGVAIDTRSAAREARLRVLSAQARALHYQDVIIPAQRELTEQTLLQYNAMQLGLFQLLQAKREELDAELALAATLGEYWSAVAELDALLAGKRVTPAATQAHASPMPSERGNTEGH